jgi:hypothetical protein
MPLSGRALLQLVTKPLWPAAAVLLVAPVFMVLKWSRYEAISTSQAAGIVASIKPVWPVVVLQFADAKAVDPIRAKYYSLLAIVASILIVLAFSSGIYEYGLHCLRQYSIFVFVGIAFLPGLLMTLRVAGQILPERNCGGVGSTASS